MRGLLRLLPFLHSGHPTGQEREVLLIDFGKLTLIGILQEGLPYVVYDVVFLRGIILRLGNHEPITPLKGLEHPIGVLPVTKLSLVETHRCWMRPLLLQIPVAGHA